jgi:hypothetical protein
MQIRRAAERGLADHGWLRSFHTFSFADYYDPKHMGYRALRVINEDRVQPGRGFGTHSHRDMEIVSYVLEGELQHKDSMGNGSIIRPGDVQCMSAGTGVHHSEFNPSQHAEVHFLQIWLTPDRTGHKPSYDQKAFSAEERDGKLRLVVSGDGREGSLTVHQNVGVYVGTFGETEGATHELAAGRHVYVHVASGAVEVNGQRLDAGDAAAIDGGAVKIQGVSNAEVLLFDLT